MVRNGAKAIGDSLRTIGTTGDKLKVCDTARWPQDLQDAANLLGFSDSNKVRGCFVNPVEIVEIKKDEVGTITNYNVKYKVQYWRSLIDSKSYAGSSEFSFVSDMDAIMNKFITNQSVEVTEGGSVVKKVEIGSMENIIMGDYSNVHYFDFELMVYDRPGND